MRVYNRKDGSRTINGKNYKMADKLGGIGKTEVWDYYNPHAEHLISIEDERGKILLHIEYEDWEDFESAFGEYDPYDNSRQAINVLKAYGYI